MMKSIGYFLFITVVSFAVAYALTTDLVRPSRYVTIGTYEYKADTVITTEPQAISLGDTLNYRSLVLVSGDTLVADVYFTVAYDGIPVASVLIDGDASDSTYYRSLGRGICNGRGHGYHTTTSPGRVLDMMQEWVGADTANTSYFWQSIRLVDKWTYTWTVRLRGRSQTGIFWPDKNRTALPRVTIIEGR